MPASPIRKLVPYADAAKRDGVKVYHLNIGQPDLPTPQKALDALKHIDRTTLEYSPSDGYLSLREKLVGYYGRFGIKITPEDVLVTTGGSEALLMTFMACMDPGDEIIMVEPGYANYLSFAAQAGLNVLTVTSRIEDDFALPDVEAFEEVITPKTRAILVCNPNNPTGYLYSKEELYRLRDIVQKYDLYLFSDEVYREFCYSDEPYVSAMDLKGIEQNVIVVDSMSKRYSECGIRIGNIVTRNKDVRDSVMKFAQARLSPPLLGRVHRGHGRIREGVLQRVSGPPQLHHRGAQRHPGCVYSHAAGRFLYDCRPPRRRCGGFLPMAPDGLPVSERDRDAGAGRRLLLQPGTRQEPGPHRLCAKNRGPCKGPRHSGKSFGGVQ